MKVWIDQELCTGDAQCVEICPEVFFMHEHGLTIRSYVKEADVPKSLEDLVVEAAEYCPGACIFVEAANDEGPIPRSHRDPSDQGM